MWLSKSQQEDTEEGNGENEKDIGESEDTDKEKEEEKNDDGDNDDDKDDNHKKDDDKKKKNTNFFYNMFSSTSTSEDNDDSDDNKDDEDNDNKSNNSWHKLLNEKILNQDDVDDNDENQHDTLDDAKASSDDDKEQKKNIWGSIVEMMKSSMSSDNGGEDKSGAGGDDGGNQNALDKVKGVVSGTAKSGDEDFSETQSTFSAEDFKKLLDKLMEQFKGNFKDVPMDKINPLAFWYYLEREDGIKNPSWKRRIHRFMPSIKKDQVFGLHDALYLSQLAYVDTVDDIKKGLEDYHGAKYELVFCTTEGKPREPAHYIMIKKEGKAPAADKDHSIAGGIIPMLTGTETYVEVVMVARGTKTVDDMCSDALLEATPYKDGKAHHGVCQSGRFLVKKNTDLLLNILKTTGRDKIKLTLLGHSLGAGAAAIACMEFNENDKIDATCIGFGCPALVNKEMSEKWKDKITTVVSDSDLVPRMSGATVVNLMIDLLGFDYKDYAMEDVKQLVDVGFANFSDFIDGTKKGDVIDWFKQQVDKSCNPMSDFEKRDIVLYPPGKCIHFYRDGVGISAVEVPCTFFYEFDVSRTMVDDHLVPTGYDVVLTETVRTHLKKPKFNFKNDVLALKAT